MYDDSVFQYIHVIVYSVYMYDLIFQFMARYAHDSLRGFCSTDDHLLLLIVRVITYMYC